VVNWRPPRCLPAAWTAADLRLAADGGADRLASFPRDAAAAATSPLSPSTSIPLPPPHRVVGDLDSITPLERERLERSAAAAGGSGGGCVVVDAASDQDSTDLEKCLRQVAAWGAGEGGVQGPGEGSTGPSSAGRGHPVGPVDVVVLGAFGGRLDHQLAHLAAARRALESSPTSTTGTGEGAPLHVTLAGDGNVAWVLGPGATHRIRVRLGDGEGPFCGILPLGDDATVSASGLRWPLDGTTLSWRPGGVLSTSNVVVAQGGLGGSGAAADEEGIVELTTSAPVVFTVTWSGADYATGGGEGG